MLNIFLKSCLQAKLAKDNFGNKVSKEGGGLVSLESF